MTEFQTSPTTTTSHALSKGVDRVGAMFSERLQRFGDGPECAEHSDVHTQERRMHQLCTNFNLQDASVLDFGCATGHLLTVLKRDYNFRGQFTGFDISNPMVETAAAKHPNAHFECRDVLVQGIDRQFDYVFVSGTFNDLVSEVPSDNWLLMKQILPLLFASSTRCLAFNNLSRYVDYFDNHFYVDPMEVFRFCKEELSPLVSVAHDYCMRDGVVPYEFSTYVSQTDIACRKLNLPTN